MTDAPRYAIYYAPAQGSPLARFGAELLGYDVHAAAEIASPATPLTDDWAELTAEPRKYGFHATLKAPFHLAGNISERDLLDACGVFASEPHELPVIVPAVDVISGFVAVVPQRRSAVLDRLAADCVATFDRFRAPLSEADRARRGPDKMTPRQRDYLDRWGYPYVMDEFRFHMTLTGHVAPERREAVRAAVSARFEGLRLCKLSIDRMAVFKQPSISSRFQVIKDWQLTA